MELNRQKRLLDIQTVTNTRELGGYKNKDGNTTNTKCYVRSASPSTISKEDIDYLYDYGIRAQIDLRSEYESNHAPSGLKDHKDIAYYHIDLFNGANMIDIPTTLDRYTDLSDIYIYIIEECKEKIKEVFLTLLKHKQDTVFFNCSAGKDRTGVISSLLLGLVGCSDDDIVQDYSESYENNQPIIKELEKTVNADRKDFLYSEPEYMVKFLRYLRETYGSSRELLLQCGLTTDQLDEITNHFNS